MAYKWYQYGEREDGLRVHHTITRYLLKPKQIIPLGITNPCGVQISLYPHREIKINKAEMRRVMKQGYYNYVVFNNGQKLEVPVHISDLELIKEEEVKRCVALPVTPEDVATPKRKRSS